MLSFILDFLFNLCKYNLGLAMKTTQIQTNSWVYESEEDDRSNDSPHRIHGALLESLSDNLIQAVTHTSQFRWKSTKGSGQLIC